MGPFQLSRLVDAYTGLATLNLSKKSGMTEVRLRDKREVKTFGVDVLHSFTPPKSGV